MKREDYINWDEYFMGVALLTAMRPRTPAVRWVRASSARKTKFLLGYNGMPIGCSDDVMPWEREGAPCRRSICMSATPS